MCLVRINPQLLINILMKHNEATEKDIDNLQKVFEPVTIDEEVQPIDDWIRENIDPTYGIEEK